MWKLTTMQVVPHAIGIVVCGGEADDRRFVDRTHYAVAAIAHQRGCNGHDAVAALDGETQAAVTILRLSYTQEEEVTCTELMPLRFRVMVPPTSVRQYIFTISLPPMSEFVS